MALNQFVNLLPSLQEWYHKHQRPFSWRKSHKPSSYDIWILEVMSQQSTMATVIPYYERWMRRFPNVHSLAAARVNTVLGLWKGLGYYSRALNIHKSAKILVKDGFPNHAHEWKKLPGVGPYTAAAVAAIALHEPVLPVDGNVIRVFSRYFGIKDPHGLASDKKNIEELVRQLATTLPLGEHGMVAQALMECGSKLCHPIKDPSCSACPLSHGCFAYKNGLTKNYPLAKKRTAIKKLSLALLSYHDSKKRILLRRIPSGYRLAGQLELPHFELQSVAELETLREHYRLAAPVRHQITHYRYEGYLIEAGAWKGAIPHGHQWVAVTDIAKRLTTTLTRKALISGHK
jgi:A/G-specific adenine glycosylase